MLRYSCLALLCVLVSAGPAAAGEPLPFRAPGIGLALSGGRAPAAAPGDWVAQASGLSPEPAYRVLVEGDPIVVAGKVAAMGGRVLGYHRFSVHAEVTRSQLEALTLEPRIRGLHLSRRLRPSLDISRKLIGADLVNEGINLPRPYTGKGTIVGIVDTGLDIAHPDFRHPDGSTRVLFLWDQTFQFTDNSQRPPGFEYGTECTAQQINRQLAGQSDACPTDDGEPIGNIPTQGHGTHVAGIAAGDSDVHRGIAPDASLIIVRAQFEEGRILDGVDYVMAKCEELQRPCVVNLSLGTTDGAHDGTSLIEQELAAKVAPGRLIVAAAGNEASSLGTVFGHGGVDLDGSGAVVHGPIAVAGEGVDASDFSMLFDIWARDGLNRRIAVTAMSRDSTGFVVHNALDFRLPPEPDPNDETGGLLTWVIEDGGGVRYGYVHMVSAVDPANTRREVLLAIDTCSDAPCVIGGTRDGRITDFDATYWALHWENLAGETGRIDVWPSNLSAYLREPAAVLPVTAWPGLGAGDYAFLGGDNEYTVTIPATSERIIAVGSMVSRNTWTDIRGRTQPAESGIPVAPVGTLSDFSSWGPTTDGRVKPDLTAPGEWIASAHSTNDNSVPSAFLLSDLYMVLPGTSMAAPHVSGVLALMLQRNPTLRVEDLVGSDGLLTRNVRVNNFTGTLPSNQWGYGLLDAAAIFADPAFVEAAESDTAAPRISAAAATVDDDRVTVRWKTNEPADSTVLLRNGDDEMRASVRSHVTNHAVVLSDVAPGTWTVTVRSVDLAGNPAVSSVSEVDVGGCGCMSRTGPTVADGAFATLVFAGLLALRLRRRR